jgi:hypothetical protein
LGSEFIKSTIKITFEGGFAVDADFTDGFSGSIEGPKIDKKRENSIKFMISPGGGSGPKHSAFCGACFSINPYSSVFGPKRQKSTPNFLEPSVFFMTHFSTFLINFDPQNHFINIYNFSCQLFQENLSRPNFTDEPF